MQKNNLHKSLEGKQGSSMRQKVVNFFSLRPRTVHKPLRAAKEIFSKNKSLSLEPFDPMVSNAKRRVLGKMIVGLFAVMLVMAPFARAYAAAYVTLNAFSGHATALQVSGGGWANGEMISLYLGSASGAPVATTTIGSDSFFGLTNVVIPANTPEGALNIFATGSVSGQTQSNSYYVVGFNPSTSPTGTANAPDSSASISGSGFLPNEPVQITTDRTGTAVQTTFNADAGGSFSNSDWHITNTLSGGPLTITIFGTHSFTSTSITYYINGQ